MQVRVDLTLPASKKKEMERLGKNIFDYLQEHHDIVAQGLSSSNGKITISFLLEVEEQ